MTNPSSINTALVEDLRGRLWLARGALFRTVARTDDELATLEAHQAGALVEDAAMETAAAILSRLEGQQRHELDEIEDALGRLESGTFGLCERCQRPIALARLRAMPAARHCVDCEEKLEKR
jgi:RNA polymerase-binding transcription factor